MRGKGGKMKIKNINEILAGLERKLAVEKGKRRRDIKKEDEVWNEIQKLEGERYKVAAQNFLMAGENQPK